MKESFHPDHPGDPSNEEGIHDNHEIDGTKSKKKGKKGKKNKEKYMHDDWLLDDKPKKKGKKNKDQDYDDFEEEFDQKGKKRSKDKGKKGKKDKDIKKLEEERDEKYDKFGESLREMDKEYEKEKANSGKDVDFNKLEHEDDIKDDKEKTKKKPSSKKGDKKTKKGKNDKKGKNKDKKDKDKDKDIDEFENDEFMDDEAYYAKKDKKEKKLKNKTQKGKKKDKKQKPKSFPKIASSKIIEVDNRNKNITTTNTNAVFLIFLYEKFYGKHLEFNNMLEELSKNQEQHGLSDVTFLRINAKKRRRIAEDLGFHEYPTLILLSRKLEINIEYEGEPNIENIVHFVHRITKNNLIEVSSIKDFTSQAQVGSNLVLVGDPSNKQKIFEKIAKYSKKYFKNTFVTNSRDFHDKFKIPPNDMDAIAFFTLNKTLNEGERMRFSQKDLTKEAIFKKGEIYSRSIFSDINHHKLDNAIYNKNKIIIYLYNNRTDPKVADTEFALKQLANKYREEYWFMRGSIDKPLTEVLTEIFRIDPSELPRLVLVDNVKSNTYELDQYIMDKGTELNEENINEFIKLHQKGKLERMILSEPLSNVFPKISEEERNKNLKLIENSLNKNNTSEMDDVPTYDHVLLEHVIGLTYTKEILENPGKDVVFFICSSIKSCKRPEKRYRRVINKLGQNDKLYFTITDILYNDLPGLNITSLPTLLMVPDININTEKKMVFYNKKEFTTTSIIDFIKENAKTPIKSILPLENEKSVLAGESKRKIKYKTRQKLEAKQEMDGGSSIGGGFIRSINRFIFQYHDSDSTYDESIDHDIDDYDKDYEPRYNKKHDDL